MQKKLEVTEELRVLLKNSVKAALWAEVIPRIEALRTALNLSIQKQRNSEKRIKYKARKKIRKLRR